MPKFRGPINLHLGDIDENTKMAEVSTQYDASGHNYVVSVTAAEKKKWQATLEEHGFSEEKDSPKSEDSDSKE